MKKSVKIGIVASRFNTAVTNRLLSNCVKTLKSHGLKSSEIVIMRVPGAYEIPWTLQEMALTKRYGVLIALGCVLKGETSQNEHMAKAVVQNIQLISLKTRTPCILGVITPQTEEQAIARTRGNLDRGREAALAALAMARLTENFRNAHENTHGT